MVTMITLLMVTRLIMMIMKMMKMMIIECDDDGSDDNGDNSRRNMYRTPSATYLVLVVHNVRYPELMPPTPLLPQLNMHRLYVN